MRKAEDLAWLEREMVEAKKRDEAAENGDISTGDRKKIEQEKREKRKRMIENAKKRKAEAELRIEAEKREREREREEDRAEKKKAEEMKGQQQHDGRSLN